MIWLIRSSPGLLRNCFRWRSSQPLKPTMPAFTCWNCCQDSPMSRLGRAHLAEMQDARPVLVGDAEDVTDYRDRKL